MARVTRIGSTVVVAMALSTGFAHGQTWVGGGTDWNTAGSWNPATVPNSTSAVVNFTDQGVGTVNISASVAAQSLTFGNLANNYNLTSGAGQSLSGVQTITVAAGVAGIENINLANVANGSLLFAAGISLTINNNSTAGGVLTIGPNTVIGTPSNGGVIFGGPGTMFFSGSFAASPNNVVGGLTKNGAGLLDYSSSGANLGGSVTLNGGTLNLDYNPNTAAKFSGFVNLNGGVLSFISNPITPVTQSTLGTGVGAGQTDIRGSGTGAVTFNAGAITHSVGGTADFNPSPSAPTFSIQTTTTNTNGLLGIGPAFATVNGGSNWAVQSGVVVAGLAGFSTNIYVSGANTDVTAPTTIAAMLTNSLRFNTGTQTLTLSGINTLQSGGVLVTPNSIGGTVTGGTLEAPSAGELLFHIYNSGFQVASALVSTTGLTKSGPGILNLTGTNTGLTGPININRGGLYITTPAAVNSTSTINFNDVRTAGSLQQFTVDLGNNTTGTISPSIRLSAFSATDYGTYFTTGNSSNTTVTLGGVISSAPGLTTPIRFTNAVTDISGFNLTGVNTFTGNVSLFQGFLGINSNASLGNAANSLFLEVGDNTNGGLNFLNSGVTVPRAVVLSFNTRIASNGADSNTISGPISGAGALVKAGTGTLTISNGANTFGGGVQVTGGTLSLGATGSLPVGTDLAVGSGATFTPGTVSINSGINTLTLFGGTFRVAAGTAQQYSITQITTGPSGGTVDFTGAGAENVLLNNAGLPGVGITVNGASTWLSPANGSMISNFALFDLPITIAPGVTFNNGIALASAGGFGFRVTGGGTLFQNSDATNAANTFASLTIAQGSRFLITDASSNGGVGNFGAGPFTLDGGTFSYGGATAATSKMIILTAAGGLVDISTAATALTASGSIIGLGSLTKTGPGTLTLTNVGDSFSGLSINAGTVRTANDATLGTGPITVAGAGTLQYTATTSTARTINLVFGVLAVSSGATLTLNGATVTGGFLVGPGQYAATGGATLSGVTTYASTTINATGTSSFTDFSNGGPINVSGGSAAPATFTRLTNQGSGTITLTATSVVNAADFQTYGVLTLNPAVVGSMTFTELVNTGTTPLNFNGGSRTFIGTAATAGPPNAPNFVAGFDLNGKNAIVAGGLFVNNGFIADSSNGGFGLATVVADFGALVKGAGYFQNPVQTINGGKFQAGNSPGAVGFGKFVLGPGGVDNYVFAIDDATGTAGPSPDAAGHVSGWGLVKVVQRSSSFSLSSPGDFTWTATPSAKLTVAIDTLINPTTVGTDIAGPMTDFDPTKSYMWPAVQWAGTYSGPTDAATLNADTAFDTSGFLNPIAGTFGWALRDSSLSLSYTPTPVPEPGTLALLTLAAAGVVVRGRRNRKLRTWEPALAADGIDRLIGAS